MRDLDIMATAKKRHDWDVMSGLLFMLSSVFSEKGKKPKNLYEFNPYRDKRDYEPKPLPGGIQALKIFLRP